MDLMGDATPVYTQLTKNISARGNHHHDDDDKEEGGGISRRVT